MLTILIIRANEQFISVQLQLCERISISIILVYTSNPVLPMYSVITMHMFYNDYLFGNKMCFNQYYPGGRKNAESLVIVITDGRSSDSSRTAAEAKLLKQATSVISIGNVFICI